MKNIIKKYITPLVVCSVILGISVSSCQKDSSYYKDGGLANPAYNGTILQYLQSNPKFDTIAQIVKLAGMENIFSSETITFFAPTDEVVRRDIGQVNSKVAYLSGGLNQLLYNANKDTIKQLSDIPGSIWRKYLMHYVFKGKFLLKDYPQLDFTLRPLYPGGYYYGYNGDLANIGVVFNSANTVQYAGYRQLCIAYIADPSNPSKYYRVSSPVSSSDIQPKNGVIHSLAVYSNTTIIYGDGNAMYADGVSGNTFGLGFDFDREVLLNK